MKYQHIALDLDGTLLRSNNTLAPRTVNAVRRAVGAGAVVAIATGRMHASALQIAAAFGVPRPIVAYNGALATVPEQQVPLVHLPLSRVLAGEILTFFRQRGWYIQSYLDNQFCVERLDSKAQAYGKLAGTVPVPLGEELFSPTGDPLKLLAVADSPEEAREMRRATRERFGATVSVVLSTALFLDMGHPQASKGYAVEQLGAFYRVPRQNILAMGDSENDRSLFTAAGYGIAMKNASEELQELADAVAESNDDDGVAQILEQLF